MTLAKGRAPNYRLKSKFQELEQGTFIRPVRKYYLPKHVLDNIGRNYDEKEVTACFTPIGCFLIPWEIIEPT